MSGGVVLPVAGGISIAFKDDAFATNPTWYRIDKPSGGLPGLQAWTVDRGRPSMLATTQAGTAQLTILDNDGTYDPTNASGPYYGGTGPFSSDIGPMRAVNIQLQNPVNKRFYNIFTGFTESWTYSFPLTPANPLMQAVVACSDGFEPLARAELVPDMSNSTTFSAVNGLNSVKIRMLAILDNFQKYIGGANGYPTDPDAMFSGNINILSAVYSPHTSLLSALQDAADAEFPGVANLFMDKYGNVAFRGRVPRFLPQNYVNGSGEPTLALPVQQWSVGDKNASDTFSGLAPLHEIEWTMDNASVINVCQCYPGGFDSKASILAQQLTTNDASVTLYGPRILAIPNLYTAGSPASTGNPYLEPAGLTGLQETLLYAKSYVQNFASPTPRITKLVFTTREPTTPQGRLLWDLLTGVEIGDVMAVYTTNPGGGGFSTSGDPDGFNLDEFFVEGIHYSVIVGGRYPFVTLTLDVSPREWFNYFNGFSFNQNNMLFGPVIGAGSDGHVINGNTAFANTSGGLTSDMVGRSITILDQTTNMPTTYTIVATTPPYGLTLSRPYTGTTSTTAPWEVYST